jgi:hypothetical protein
MFVSVCAIYDVSLWVVLSLAFSTNCFADRITKMMPFVWQDILLLNTGVYVLRSSEGRQPKLPPANLSLQAGISDQFCLCLFSLQSGSVC